MFDKYEAVIGLEVHAQLLTDSKIFCGCSSKFGSEPNTNICPVCLGSPGVLPVLNKKAVEFIALMGYAVNCRINKKSVFARKNYFYPDLPKGYQISQYDLPVCEDGFIEITKKDGSVKKIRIKRIHLEEDAGKSIHDQPGHTLIDVNRCGVPLIEIVTEPDINTSEEAYLYLASIKQIVQYLNICDANMEEGSLRCDANISVKLKGEKKLGTKTEVKNMNSFRNVERAIDFEIGRQIELIEEGGKVVQQTLLWNANKNEAYPMRSKEEAHDYRYFPDPDLVPVLIDDDWESIIKKNLPELPSEKKQRFINEFSLPEYDAEVLTQSKAVAEYFEEAGRLSKDYKLTSNWVMVDVLKILNEKNISIKDFTITPDNLSKLVTLISTGKISGKIAKEVFDEMLSDNKNPEDIVKEKNLLQISDPNEIENIIEKILSENQQQVEEYLSGKDKVLGFFVGKIMKESKGKANPALVNKLLKECLSKKS